MAHQTDLNRAFDRPVFQWEAPQFIRFTRGWKWHLSAAVLFGAMGLYALTSQAWIMLVTLLTVYVILVTSHAKKPELFDLKISEYGIAFGPKIIPYSSTKKFWIIHDLPYVNELHILTTDRLHPEVTIPLLNYDPSLLRQYLLRHIPEWEGKREDFLDIIVRLFKLQ